MTAEEFKQRLLDITVNANMDVTNKLNKLPEELRVAIINHAGRFTLSCLDVISKMPNNDRARFATLQASFLSMFILGQNYALKYGSIFNEDVPGSPEIPDGEGVRPESCSKCSNNPKNNGTCNQPVDCCRSSKEN